MCATWDKCNCEAKKLLSYSNILGSINLERGSLHRNLLPSWYWRFLLCTLSPPKIWYTSHVGRWSSKRFWFQLNWIKSRQEVWLLRKGGDARLQKGEDEFGYFHQFGGMLFQKGIVYHSLSTLASSSVYSWGIIWYRCILALPLLICTMLKQLDDNVADVDISVHCCRYRYRCWRRIGWC